MGFGSCRLRMSVVFKCVILLLLLPVELMSGNTDSAVPALWSNVGLQFE